MATTRAIVIRKTVEKYVDKDFENVDEFISKLERKLENIYEDENLLNEKVETFIKAVCTELKKGSKKIIQDNREQEKESCGLNDREKRDVSDTFESKNMVVDKKLDDLVHNLEAMLEKMREKVENKDRSDSDIRIATRKALGQYQEGLSDEYRTNSKKMVNELDEKVREYIEEMAQYR